MTLLSGLINSYAIFISGDGSKWLIASKQAVIGELYDDAKRQVLQSSLNNNTHTVTWHNRQEFGDDPWISLTDHVHISSGDGTLDMLYGEYSSGDHITTVRDNDGANVYIRYTGKICNMSCSLQKKRFHTPHISVHL